jgi:thiol-disulfide isomerase/thioredoxin
VNKKSLLIHYVKEELDITKLPEISEYFISNFREIDSIEFSKYKLNSLEYYNGKAMLDKSEKSKPIANEVVLIKELNQDFLFYDLNDNIHILNDFNERYFVIEFWFCGCLPCIKSSKVIAEIESEYNGRIKFLELNYMNNDKEQIKNYLANRKNKNNVYYLKNNILDNFISIYTAPTIIIYDKEKEKILYKNIGYSPNFKNDLVYALNNLMFE